jgi:hypothetical protein
LRWFAKTKKGCYKDHFARQAREKSTSVNGRGLKETLPFNDVGEEGEGCRWALLAGTSLDKAGQRKSFFP